MEAFIRKTIVEKEIENSVSNTSGVQEMFDTTEETRLSDVTDSIRLQYLPLLRMMDSWISRALTGRGLDNKREKNILKTKPNQTKYYHQSTYWLPL